jgi:hypothetical protein
MKAVLVLIIVSLLAVFCSAGIVAAKEYEVNKKTGEYSILIKIDKNPPVAGKNNIEIAITDASGKTVTDAKVALSYSMPPMAGMPAMSYKTEAELKGSVYRAKVDYSMAGSWNNELKIIRGGKTASARFTIDAK